MQVELEHAELQAQHDTLQNNYRLLYGALAVILEEQGGLVKIDRETLENYDLNTQIQMWHDPSDDSWNVKVDV